MKTVRRKQPGLPGSLERNVLRGEGLESGCYRPVVPDEASLEVSKPHGPLELLAGGGSGPVSNRPGLRWIHLDTPGTDNEPQE